MDLKRPYYSRTNRKKRDFHPLPTFSAIGGYRQLRQTPFRHYRDPMRRVKEEEEAASARPNQAASQPALFMRVRCERMQQAEIVGTRGASDPRRGWTPRPRVRSPRTPCQIGLVHARSRSLMDNARSRFRARHW